MGGIPISMGQRLHEIMESLRVLAGEYESLTAEVQRLRSENAELRAAIPESKSSAAELEGAQSLATLDAMSILPGAVPDDGEEVTQHCKKEHAEAQDIRKD